MLMSREKAESLGLPVKGVIRGFDFGGIDPAYMGLGPIPATRKLLKKLDMKLSDIDYFELNEAFASQALACIRALGLDEAKVNPKGGAIAVGHPLGCTGARMVTTLVHEMSRTKVRRGLATLCVGVGQGVATLIDGVEA